MVSRIHPILTGLRRCVAALLWLACPGCSSSGDAGTAPDAAAVRFCSSISAAPTGVTVACARPVVVLHDVHYGSTGAMESFAFTVTCGVNAARGTWDEADGLQCVEGAFGCDGGTCAPMSTMDCRLAPNCQQSGQCDFSNGQCILTDDGCAHSEIPCGVNGACHLGADGNCVVSSDADCQMPFGNCPSCQFKGACTYSGNCFFENGACVARSDSDCRVSQQCHFAGKCSLIGNACGAASDTDCLGADVCSMSGQCKARDGICSAF